MGSEPLVKSPKANFGGKLNKSSNEKNMTKSGSKRSVQLPNASEIELLQRLLDVSPERLRFMKKAIERVESMSPEQKKNIKERLSKPRRYIQDHAYWHEEAQGRGHTGYSK